MSIKVVLRPDARSDFDISADWYEQRRVGLGGAFSDAVQQCLGRIVEQPDFFPEVFQGVREAKLSGFPFCIYYLFEPDQVVVLSIFHTSRNPSVWKKRC